MIGRRIHLPCLGKFVGRATVNKSCRESVCEIRPHSRVKGIGCCEHCLQVLSRTAPLKATRLKYSWPSSQSFGVSDSFSKTILAKVALDGRSQNRKHRDLPRKAFYVKRREAGLCTYGACPELPQQGHTQCPMHLQWMRNSEKKRRNTRIAKGLCPRCGELPRFWGLKCVLCRQSVAGDPLPAGARKALRLYRKEQAKHIQSSIEDNTRAAVIDLLSKGTVTGKYAEALRLYAGLETHEWRTYEEVGKIMRLTKERVRQLLAPSKDILSAQLSGRVPWATSKPSNSLAQNATAESGT